jgi:NAD(P)-dependent dehydrogenase (short-subunit alcohol dehydrogenase family)
MDLQLKDKLAVVTGSTKGIGHAIAKALDAEGARVILNGRSQTSIDAALKDLGKNAQGIVGDISTAKGAEEFVTAVKKIGAPDILINNMGIFEPKPFLEIPDADWEKFYQANVMSGVRMSRAFLPAMLKNNWGRIIFISSESALNIPEEMIHYGMTKTAQLAIARGLAETTRGTKVTVNSVLPGPTYSEGVEDFVQQVGDNKGKTRQEIEKDFFTHVRPSSILGRFTDPAEIANMVAYVASPLSSATNGAALRADGGTYKSI